MSERVGLSEKKSESKGRSLAAVKPETDWSPVGETDSPLERILYLQRTIGNRAVTRLIESGTLQTNTPDSRTPAVTPDLEASIKGLKGGGQSLPESSRAFFEPRFGADFSSVRIHTGSRAAETARSINAKAFTTGRDIVFGFGQYAPHTTIGRHLLAHELTHTLQQGQRFPLSSRKILREQYQGPTSSACANTVFYIHLDLPIVSDRYFRDGTEISESQWRSGLRSARSRENSCEISVSREIEIPGPNPTINVNLLYTRSPCCNCFSGNISWNLTVDGRRQADSVSEGSCSGEPCCAIQRTVNMDFTVLRRRIVGTVSINGHTYPQSS